MIWKNKRKTFSKRQEGLPLWNVTSPRKKKARVNLSEIPTSTNLSAKEKTTMQRSLIHLLYTGFT